MQILEVLQRQSIFRFAPATAEPAATAKHAAGLSAGRPAFSRVFNVSRRIYVQGGGGNTRLKIIVCRVSRAHTRATGTQRDATDGYEGGDGVHGYKWGLRFMYNIYKVLLFNFAKCKCED